MKKHVIQVPLSQIKPYWRNPRNTSEAVDTICASIQKYGFVTPMVLDKNKVVIAGHVRLQAARLLKLKAVPCVIVDLTEKEASQLRIIDNKVAELATWDREKLVEELKGIVDLDALTEAFSCEDWMALITAEFGDDFSREQSPIVGTPQSTDQGPVNPQNPAEGNAAEVPCPHCGMDNTFHIFRNKLVDADQQDVEQEGV